MSTREGKVRGITWAVLYSPEARRFNPQLKLPAAIDSTKDATVLFSWWGLPGTGIGGMQSGGSDLGIFQDGYRYGAQQEFSGGRAGAVVRDQSAARPLDGNRKHEDCR